MVNRVEELTAFVSTELLMRDDGNAVGADDDLLMSGLLDSIAVMRLVGFIETDLNLAVPPEDVTLENFSSVSAISRYLEAMSSGEK